MQGHGITRHCQQPHAPACARHGHVLVLPWAARTRVSPSRRRNARVHEALRASGLRSVRGPKLVARGKQPATRSSSSQAKFSFRHRGHRTGVHTDETQARGLARGRAPLSPLAFFLDSTELYVYLCTVVHTSVRIPLYSTRLTISLIVQQKKLSTSNKPITHSM